GQVGGNVFVRLGHVRLGVGLAVGAGVAVAVGAGAVEAQLLQQLGRNLGGVLALGVAAAPHELAAAALADDHRLAALLAVDVRRDRRRLGGQELALLVEVDDRLALGVARAAQELAEAAAPLDHLLAALGTLVLRQLADGRLALLVHRLGRAALGVAD